MRRLFFGLNMPDEWKVRLREVQHRLQQKQIEAGGWTNPQLLHITVLFLGMVPDEHLPLLQEAGQEAAQQVEPIELTTGALGEFSRNKVFWLGLDRNVTDWQRLNQLHEIVKASLLSRLPMDLDEKKYKPHITLARKMNSRVDVSKLEPVNPLHTKVTELCLFESVRIDGRLTYPILERFPLATNGSAQSE